LVYLDKYLDAVQGQDRSVREVISMGVIIQWTHCPREGTYEVFSTGDTSVGDTFLEKKIYFV
jgi:hypothetical protein